MELTINRGKRHEYLGMVFDFNKTGEVKITMYQYLDGLIEGAPEIYKISSRENGVGMATPAPHNLYDVRNPDSEGNGLLPGNEQSEYHTLTAQCLYASKRGRPDLGTSIAFHCTRVRTLDTDDQKKLSKNNTTPHSNNTSTVDIKSEQSWHHRVVGGCFICRT